VKSKKKLGEILVSGKVLTEEQLLQLLRAHKQSELKFGQFLVREGAISEQRLVDLLAGQLKIHKYAPETYPVDINLSSMIPSDVAQKYQLVPLVRSELLLTVAMLDPMDIDALDAIEILTNLRSGAGHLHRAGAESAHLHPLRHLFRYRRCSGRHGGDEVRHGQ
jgi:type IV pilus assembly protein PilB